MATNLGSLAVYLTADTQKYRKGMSRAQQLTRQFAAGVKVALAAAAVAFVKSSVQAGVAAEEIGSKYATVFKDIGSAAEQSAKQLAFDFDLADSTAKELLGTTGDLLTGFGFTAGEAMKLADQVNRLAIDLASFSNYAGGAKGASEALTKALLGETESAKGLGIVIRQNAKEFRDRVAALQSERGITEQQAKAYAILEEATKQSKNALGDYARTSGSAANRQRALAESFKQTKELVGQGLTPAYADLLNFMNSWLRETNRGIKLLNDFDRALTNVFRGSAEDFRRRFAGKATADELARGLILLTKYGKTEAGRARAAKLLTTLTTRGIAAYEREYNQIIKNLRADKKRLDAAKKLREEQDKLLDKGIADSINSFVDAIEDAIAKEKELDRIQRSSYQGIRQQIRWQKLMNEGKLKELYIQQQIAAAADQAGGIQFLDPEFIQDLRDAAAELFDLKNIKLKVESAPESRVVAAVERGTIDALRAATTKQNVLLSPTKQIAANTKPSVIHDAVMNGVKAAAADKKSQQPDVELRKNTAATAANTAATNNYIKQLSEGVKNIAGILTSTSSTVATVDPFA